MIRTAAVLSFLLGCCLATRAAASPTIIAGNHSLLPNTPGQQIYIRITPGPFGNTNGFGFLDGNEQTVVGIDLNIGVLPSATLPASVRPILNAVDLIGPGLIYNTIPGARQLAFPPFNPPAWEVGAIAIALPGLTEVFADGLLARITVDTTGILDEATWPFVLQLPSIGLPTDVGQGDSNLSVFLVDGTLSIVPEPSSFALLGVGAISLLAVARRQMRC